MKKISLFGLIAMVPAVLNVSPASAHAAVQGAILVPICSGDGVSRSISMPLGPQDIPGKQVPGCCVKGCHGGERKRAAKKCC